MPSVLYIHPAKLPGWVKRDGREAFASYQVMPVGAIGLANMLLQAGFAVTGLNYAMELDINPQFDLQTWLRRREVPLLVMVDLHWLEHSFGALEVARVCRGAFPDTPVVLGGMTASLYAGEILEEFPQVQFVIRGDAEVGLNELAWHLAVGEPRLPQVANLSFRQDGEVHHNPLSYTASTADLDSLDFVELGFLEHCESYRLRQSSQYGVLRGHWLCVGRGCTLDCCWCGGGRAAQEHIAGRHGLVLRSPNRLAQDMRRLADEGVQQAALTHDLALGGPQYAERVLTGMRQDGARLGLWHQQFQLPSAEFLDALAASAPPEACLLELSPLSGNEAVRRRNGKFFSNAEFLKALRRCGELELPVFVYFSLNLPGESEHTYPETLALARRVREVCPVHLLRMSNMYHTIDPGSPMATDPAKHGLRLKWDGFVGYYRYCQQPVEVEDTRAATDLRGFEAVEQPPLAEMFDQWVDLCDELGEDTCLHFP